MGLGSRSIASLRRSRLSLSNGSLFAIRLKPRKDESWPGAILRLASENGLRGLKKIAALFGTSVKRLLALDPADGWNTIVSTTSDIKPLPSARTFRSRLSLYTRVCVQCLLADERPYARAYWDHPLSLTCQVHKTLLLDTCRACGKRIDYLRREISRCQCGAHFAETHPQEAPPWVSEMLSLFIEPEHRARGERFEQATRLQLRAARALLRLARAQEDPKKPLIRARTIIASVPLVRRSHLVHLFAWFGNGTTSFVSRMEEQLKHDGASLRSFRENLQLDNFPKISRVTLDASAPAHMRKQEMQAQGQTVFYNCRDIEKMFSVSTTTRGYWQKIGLLPSPTSRSSHERWKFPADAVDKISALHDQGCSREEAAEVLGCSTEVIYKLLLLRAVKATGFAPKINLDRPDRASLTALSNALLSRASALETQRGQISFEKLAQSIRTPYRWSRFRALAGTSITILLRPGGTHLGDVGFLRKELALHGVIGKGSRWN